MINIGIIIVTLLLGRLRLFRQFTVGGLSKTDELFVFGLESRVSWPLRGSLSLEVTAADPGVEMGSLAGGHMRA